MAFNLGGDWWLLWCFGKWLSPKVSILEIWLDHRCLYIEPWMWVCFSCCKTPLKTGCEENSVQQPIFCLKWCESCETSKRLYEKYRGEVVGASKYFKVLNLAQCLVIRCFRDQKDHSSDWMYLGFQALSLIFWKLYMQIFRILFQSKHLRYSPKHADLKWERFSRELW